jgi:predicted alpha/beta-hydrolase family hydrolase
MSLRPAGLLLAHGAGGGADHPLFLALEAALDLPVRRMEFPYRREGRRAPDRAPKLMASIREEVEDFSTVLGVGPERLLLGGRSMGGRMCSMVVAEGLPAAGLVLLSYPLHPPGKPERLRVEHFGAIEVATLLVNGDRDPFGSPEEVEREIAAIAGPVTLHWLQGQRHDPKPSCDAEIIAVVESFVEAR